MNNELILLDEIKLKVQIIKLKKKIESKPREVFSIKD